MKRYTGAPRSQISFGDAIMGEAPLRNVHDYGITIDSAVDQRFSKAQLWGQLRSQMKFGNEKDEEE